ncbi:ABC transporter substrate-binding protein [Mesorhizobium sp. BR1-1-16]|uniref:ABC transporter substrate-binding protein n=1 Tax=Mesorhizobium sp. BR1-1-16 TaxID=2876653 RepID=UPI001CCD5071|nr:ABC transporter substrate-binding protein [Mesorhizobium sp. BR1-1-16]MBZ9937000.1 ABC transporter substrate-binding protein [Mesorhizobium sp. BR1-1-16]
MALIVGLSVKAVAGANAHDMPVVTVSTLAFGTVDWELDTIAHHALDSARGIEVLPLRAASGEAAKLALITGATDLIVTDWLWVARQRAEGRKFVFLPYSRAVGALMVPSTSPLATMNDLKGRRIGIAGGPLDKSWLLLRAYWRKRTGSDIEAFFDPEYGAAPLLNAELERGRLDATLTFWTYAARVQAAGGRPLIQVSEIMAALGVDPDVPLLGFVARADWAREHRPQLDAFLQASRTAKQLIIDQDQEWQRISHLTGTSDPALLAELRRQYQLGFVRHWGATEKAAASRMFDILRELGGEGLVGRSDHLDPAIFWTGASY